MAEDEVRPQRLYLARGESEVYVDTVVLPQHQIDGIRFLYQQFVKRQPGVIMNDPHGYGKRVQTILFLCAVLRQLNLPILILCSEGKEQLWAHLFNTWTDMGSEVSVQKGTSAPIDPVCHISALPNLFALERREWSVLVVDEHHGSLKILDSKVRGNYRIWLSSNDMKSQLSSFAFIYMWLYPKEQFVLEDFQTSKNTPTAVLMQSAKLDAFMEDIVIRRKKVMVPLGKCDKIVYPAQISRKNKDATGKKIKRSKQNHEHNLDSCSEPQVKLPKQVSKNGDQKRNETVNNDFKVFVNDTHNKMDIDAGVKDLTPDVSTDNKKCNNEHENKFIKENEKEVKEANVNIDFNNKADLKEPFKSGSVTDCNTLDTSYKLLSSDEIITQNIRIKYDSDTPDTDDENRDNNYKKDSELKHKIILVESEDMFPSGALSVDIKSDIKMINRDICIVPNDKTDIKNNEVRSEEILSADLSMNKVKSETEVKKDDINRNKNEIVNKNNVSENNKTDPELDGIELKMKQMEELAMKKFKGSFLDNMF